MSLSISLSMANKMVQEIKDSTGDPEQAHSLEDGLRDYFIRLLSLRTDQIGGIAKVILSTNEIDFPRWCA